MIRNAGIQGAQVLGETTLRHDQVRVVHIDDDPVDHVLVSRCAKRAPGDLQLHHAPSFDAMRDRLRAVGADVVLLDLNFERYRGFEALHAILQMDLDLPVVVLTGMDDPTLGPLAVSLGAEDFLFKDVLDPQMLWSVVMKACARWQNRVGPRTGRGVVPHVGMPTSVDLRPGDVIGAYEIVDEIAEGGMATVYKIRHRSLDSTHALKVVRSGVLIEHARLVQEGRVQARLRHPNLVSATDLIEFADGARGLVMEYVAGPTLDQWLQTSPDRSGRSWFSIFVAVTRGVHCAHLDRVVHRDLKPSNVLLHRVPHGLVPKVSDFGIAKVLADGPVRERDLQTRGGIAMGTPGFMPPEQLVDAASVDERADIFALGCLLFCVASGQRPFPRGHHVAQLRAMMRGDVPDLARLVPGLGPSVLDVTRRAMAFDKEERFQSCADLLSALDAVPAKDLAERVPMPNPQDDRTHPLPSLEAYATA